MSEPIYNSAGEVLYPGLAGDGAGYRGSRLVTLTPEGWEKAEGTWPLMQAAPVPEAKTGYVALGSYPDSYGAAADAAAAGVRIKMLEMQFGSGIDGSSFVTAFDTLDGVELTGVWNKKASRIDF